MINLLPLKEKKELQKEEQYKISLILAIVFLAFLLFLFLVLSLINIYISTELGLLENNYNLEKKSFEESGTKELEDKLTVANKDFSALKSFYSNQTKLIIILEEINESLPQGFYMKSFFWDKESNKISITGFAPVRDDLFKLQSSLENKFQNIDIPREHWLKAPQNIEFSASFTINNF